MAVKKFKEPILLPKPTDTLAYFEAIKDLSNHYWQTIELDKATYGFQFQKDSVWKKGLDADEITLFEKELGYALPPPLYHFYRTMNGLDKQGINLYGSSGHPYAYFPVFYSYPEDMAIIKEKIAWIYEEMQVNEDDLLQRGISRIFPICGHRFLLIDDSQHRILSMYGSDIVPWADSLSKLLARSIFFRIANKDDFANDRSFEDIVFWLDEPVVN